MSHSNLKLLEICIDSIREKSHLGSFQMSLIDRNDDTETPWGCALSALFSHLSCPWHGPQPSRGGANSPNQNPRGDQPHRPPAAAVLSRAKAGPRKNVHLGQGVLQTHLPGTSESVDCTVSLSQGNILEPDHPGSDSDLPATV